MTVEPNYNEACAAYEDHVLDSNEGVDKAGVLHEARLDTVRLTTAAQRLKLAVETYLSDLKGYHIGASTSDATELCRLIVDYDQDDVGHKASDVLRAALV